MKDLRKLPHKYWMLLLIIFILITSCSPGKRVFSKIETSFKESPVFQNGFSGLVVYDPEKKKILYAHNGSKYFTPASNTKLLTFFTGLKILGDSVPALEYSLTSDSLVFSGTGDPSFLHPELPQGKVLSFLKMGERDLFYLPPKPIDEPFGPGWAWDDYNAYYSVERSAFPIYGNQVVFTSIPDQVVPQSFPSLFKDSLIFDPSIKNRIKRTRYNNQFRYPPNFRYRSSEQTVPIRTSTRTTIAMLEDTLGKPVHVLDPRMERQLDKVLNSIPTDSLYKRMLQVSDNFIAEQILLLAAQEISDTLQADQAIEHMKKHHLQDLPHELQWVDGSGLSRYNLTTPRNTVRLLEKIKNEVPYETLFQLLPAGGQSGTLKEQFKAAIPFVFAKTGSLSNNYSLSGYMITKKGKILLFSFMNSNYILESATLKKEMERILRSIRNNY